MWRSATISSPLRSKRARISPESPRAKASGFTRIRVLSMVSFGSLGMSGSGARAPSASAAARRGGRLHGRCGLLVAGVGGGRDLQLGNLALRCRGGAPATGARRRDTRYIGLAVRADRPRLVERARTVHAALLELAQAAGAAHEVALDAVVAVRAQRLAELVQARLGSLHLQFALVHVLQVLRRA